MLLMYFVLIIIFKRSLSFLPKKALPNLPEKRVTVKLDIKIYLKKTVPTG